MTFLNTHGIDSKLVILTYYQTFPIYLKCFQENIWNASSLYYKEVLRTNPMSIHLVLVFIFASVLWPKIWTTHSNFLYTNRRKSSIICCPKIRSSVVTELCSAECSVDAGDVLTADHINTHHTNIVTSRLSQSMCPILPPVSRAAARLLTTDRMVLQRQCPITIRPAGIF